ncbi:hypothetical protein BGC07_03725 [Piscirickettsia litoralis]|uniref:Uncharacterized protein n=2 Tax=Piscirickettsia litoralis TaxID=1891921 RepID=A0ABX3A018_9GAMM|nr:hypothetical protein BGC07_03725 [Piscirickettsia litoralis]
MSLMHAQDHVAPVEKQDKKNANVLRWFNKRLFPRIAAMLEKKPEKGLAMADDSCAKQAILEAIAEYIKVIEETLPRYKDMALVFKIRSFISDALPIYHAKPKPDPVINETKDQEEKVLNQDLMLTESEIKFQPVSVGQALPAHTTAVAMQANPTVNSSKWQKLLQSIEQAKQLYDNQQFNKAFLLTDHLEKKLKSFDPLEYFEEELSGLADLKAVLIPYAVDIESTHRNNTMAWKKAQDVCDMSITTFMKKVDDKVLSGNEELNRQSKKTTETQIKQEGNSSSSGELDDVVKG